MAASPGPVVQNLITIARLSEPEFRALISALSTGFFETRRSVTQAVRDALLPERRHGAAELASMLMAFARLSHEESEEETQRNVAELVEDPELELTDDERQVMARRVHDIVSCKDLVLAARTSYVERNHEKIMSGTEIGTDMRPMISPEGSLESVVLWHSLTVQYHSRSSETEPTDTFVVDYSDLLDLKEQIDDALKSREGIQRQMSAAGVAVWSPYSPKKDEIGQSNDN